MAIRKTARELHLVKVDSFSQIAVHIHVHVHAQGGLRSQNIGYTCTYMHTMYMHAHVVLQAYLNLSKVGENFFASGSGR